MEMLFVSVWKTSDIVVFIPGTTYLWLLYGDKVEHSRWWECKRQEMSEKEGKKVWWEYVERKVKCKRCLNDGWLCC